MARLAILYHPIFAKHDPGAGHPESSRRVLSIMETLKSKGFLSKAPVVTPSPASPEQIALVHDSDYVALIRSKRGTERFTLDGGDTVLNAFSAEAAETAAGAAVAAVDMIFEQGYDKIFAAVRPPGHHAERSRGMGFCLFNNAAIATQYALSRNYAQKVLIVDWDVHHGNGTQEIFYTSDRVFYLSLHQFPLYPMTGTADETGQGRGEGFTRNIPLPAGTEDDGYVHALEKALLEIESILTPDLVIISAGFDAHVQDPLGGMRVTEQGFYKLTEIVATFAQKNCNGRVISFLEGGYSFPGLALSVYQHVHCLLKH